MTNMSYCRFRNTLEALRECADDLANKETLDELASADEREAARRLLKLCDTLASDWGIEVEQASHKG
jgi:hypothetical protein